MVVHACNLNYTEVEVRGNWLKASWEKQLKIFFFNSSMSGQKHWVNLPSL
jgi:hypothetical protein